MARTKPKPRLVTIGSSGYLNFYNKISVGDVIFMYSSFFGILIPNNFITEISGLPDERFFYATITQEVYNKIKNDTLTDAITYINGFYLGGITYYAVLKNARFVQFRTDTGSGGIPASGALTANEGDGIVIVHKSASTNLTGSVNSNNYTTLNWPSTGKQSFYHQRSGGTAGSYTPPSLTPASQTGAWTLKTFYFETANPIDPISYTGPYIVQNNLLNSSSGRTTAYLPSQTEVGDLVINVHASATAVPSTPTNWTSLTSGTAIPAFNMYYKYISNIDTDDAFTDYGTTDLLYTALIANAGTGTFVAGSVTTTINTGTVGNQPIINSMENTQPYQLGFFVGIKKTELGGDINDPNEDVLIMDSTNGWNLSNSLPAQNNFGLEPARISMAISTYNAVEEQVLPPSQMAFNNTIESLGTAYSTTYPNVAINFLMKNNQQ